MSRNQPHTLQTCPVILSVIAIVLVCGTDAQAFEMEWVTVGDPGNAPDDEVMSDGTSGYGGVAYTFKIGKYEVANAQYAEFLNAVAASDPHGLYSSRMAGDHGGIVQSGVDGAFTYMAIAGREDTPVAFVSWYDSLRFANWMHNGQGGGDTEDGAYDMSLGTGAVRKPDALVFLPSEDEWYKAAYYKAGAIDAGYWDYPTQTDDLPTAEVPPGADMIHGSANYDSSVGDVTAVGAYTTKPSDGAYGTFDQAGNVWEWNEADIFGDGAYRGVRGGSFSLDGSNLRASYRWQFADAPHESYLGIRVASPNSIVIGAGTYDAPDGSAGTTLRVQPNPSRGAIAIMSDIGFAGSTLMSIYDASGRLVRRVESSGVDQVVKWDGHNAFGRRVSPGVYFVRLIDDTSSKVTRITIIR